MKTLFLLFLLSALLSLNSFSEDLVNNKTDEKIFDISKVFTGKGSLVVSVEKMKNRDDARKFCESRSATLAKHSLIVGFLINSTLDQKDFEKYTNFDFTKIIREQNKNASEMSGVMSWADDKFYSGKAAVGENAEIIMTYNGRGGAGDFLTIDELNSLLKSAGGTAQSLHAICEKPLVLAMRQRF